MLKIDWAAGGRFILSRLREPSTWAGIGVVLGALGLTLTEIQAQALAYTGSAIAGLIATVLPDSRA